MGKEVGSCASHVRKEVRSWYTHLQPSKHVKGTNDGCTRMQATALQIPFLKIATNN